MPTNSAETSIASSTELKLLRSEEKFHFLFQHSPIGMAMVDHATGQFLEVNQSVLNSTGYTREEFLKLSYWDITPKEYEIQELEQIEELNRTGRFGAREKEYIRKDGSRYPIRIRGFILTETDGRKVVWGIVEDISEQKQAEQEIRNLAFYDTLTTLANRRLLNERIDIAMADSRRSKRYAALVVLDLDGFKPLNDRHGHVFGDLLLVEVGQRLKACVRDVDTVARYGGDEFVVLISDLHKKLSESGLAAKTIAEKIQAAISQPYCLTTVGADGLDIAVEHTCTASIGVALFVDDEVSREEVFSSADAAMYQAKEAGRNLIRFAALARDPQALPDVNKPLNLECLSRSA